MVDVPSQMSLFEIDQPWPWADTVDISQPGFWWLPQDDAQLLVLVQDGVTEQMCEDLTGPVDLSLTVRGPLLGLLVRFNGPDPRRPRGWSDWVESVMFRLPGHFPASLEPDNVPEGKHLVFIAHLVDSRTGLLRHQRVWTVSPHFTKMLVRETNDRWKPGIPADEANLLIDDWYERYPTATQVLKDALARSHSGD